MATSLSVPPQAVAKTKVAATPTTVQVAPKTKVSNPTPATPVGVATKTSISSATTPVAGKSTPGSIGNQPPQTAPKPKTVTTAPVVASVNNIHNTYR